MQQKDIQRLWILVFNILQSCWMLIGGRITPDIRFMLNLHSKIWAKE